MRPPADRHTTSRQVTLDRGDRPSLSVRARWATIGAVLALVAGGATLGVVRAAGGSTASAFVPITPCRLLDTRVGADNVGPRAAPIGAGETYTLAARGAVGKCTIPADATGLVVNTTAVNPTAASYLTVFPGGADRPLAASLNTVAGGAPTPNLVTVSIGDTGVISIYNHAGTVDVVGDVTGWFVPSPVGAGPVGPAGATGPTGPAGPQGPSGAAVPLDPSEIAQLRWDLAPAVVEDIGGFSDRVWTGFDGTSIWLGADESGGGSHDLARLDPATGSSGAVTVPGDVLTGGFAFDGTSIWVGGRNRFVQLGLDGSLLRSIAVTGSLRGLAFDGTHVWGAATESDKVYRVTVATGAVDTITVTGGPIQLAYDGRDSVWVTRYYADKVTRIDLNAPFGTFDVSTTGNPQGIAFDGRFLWVALEASGSIARIDPNASPNPAVSFIDLGLNGAWGVAFDGDHLWVSETAGRVTSIASGTVDHREPLAGGARGIAFDGTNMWVAEVFGVARIRVD